MVTAIIVAVIVLALGGFIWRRISKSNMSVGDNVERFIEDEQLDTYLKQNAS